MNPYLRKGAVLIDSYSRVRTEQQAAMARLKNVRRDINPMELQNLEDIIYYPYDDIIDRMETEIALLCEGHIPVYRDFMSRVLGLNIYDALQLLVLLKDVKKFETVSKFWKFCGFAPVEYCAVCNKRYFKTQEEAKNWFNSHKIKGGRMLSPPFCTCNKPKPYYAAEKRIKGMMPDYNEKIKKILITIGNKLIRAEGFYRDRFFEYQNQEYKKDSTLSDIHISNRAKRKVVKLFLYHLYNAWRQTEGLDEQKPYSTLPEFEEELV